MTQYARPTSDITTAWTVTPLFSKINEVVRDDANFITGTGPTKTAEMLLSTVTDPNNDTNHVWNIVLKATGSSAGEKVTVTLYEGGTLIETLINAGTIVRNAFNLWTGTLVNAANISDYTNLRVRMVTGGSNGASETIQCSWFELQVPDASQTIEETVTLDKFAGTSSDMNLLVLDSVSLSRSLGTGNNEIENANDEVIQARIAQLNVLDQVNESDILNLESFYGLSVEGLPASQNITETVVLDKFCGISINGYRLVEESVSLSRFAGEGGSELGNLKDILNLGYNITIIPVDQTNEKDSLILGRSNNIVQSTQTNEKDAINLGRSSSIIPVSQTNEKDGIILVRSSDISILEHQSVLTENIVLTRFDRLTIFEEAQGELNEGIILARSNGINISSQSIINDLLNLSQLYGLVINNGQYSYESISLEYSNGLSAIGIQNIFEQITLRKIDSITTMPLVMLFNSINLTRLMSILAEPPSTHINIVTDHIVGIPFRDKRFGVWFRDKRTKG